MKIKELLLPLLLAFGCAWFVQNVIFSRWFGSTQQPSMPEKASFVAPVQADDVSKPLNTEVDFASRSPQRLVDEATQEIKTGWGTLVFSDSRAVLKSICFSHTVGGVEHNLTTLPERDMDKGMFLVAFQKNTPQDYVKTNLFDSETAVCVEYLSSTSDAVVRKRFFVHKDAYKIDLELYIEPKKGSLVEPRILYAAPTMVEGRSEPSRFSQAGDTISSVVIDSVNVFEKTAITSLDTQKGWVRPAVFGADSRYFLHALVQDKDQFVVRAYYGLSSDKLLTAIVEGVPITKPTTVQLSFYVGPKEINSLLATDNRLEKTLDYSGILAPISKFLLRILKLLAGLLGGYGWAIIALTFLVKLLLVPFTIKSEKSMRQQAEIQKKLAYIQQKYKHDPEALDRERSEIIKKHGVPGLGGCLTLLVQLPIFIALNRVLYSAFELYRAPMLWIKDLSVADPYYILPFLIFVAMLAQAVTADAQQRLSLIAMAFIFGALSSNFAAGLALYFFVSTLLGVLQTNIVRYYKKA